MSVTAETLSGRGKGPISVGLIDDHPVVLDGLKVFLGQAVDFRVLGAALNWADFERQIDVETPEVVVVDLDLRKDDGLRVIRAIRSRSRRIRTVAFSMFDEENHGPRALRAGARGYVEKDGPPERLLEAIRWVRSGGVFASAASVRRWKNAGDENVSPTGGVDRLSDQEFRVFKLIGRGCTRNAIASQLFVSVKTVEAHRENIKRKLRVDGASRLVCEAAYFLQSGQDRG